jgi:nucleoside-diphosphate-sugar epimerase
VRILYIGGSGEISRSCVDESLRLGHEVTVLNRGRTDADLPAGVRQVRGDLAGDGCYAALEGQRFDSVCQFLALDPAVLERDRRAFGGRTGQYVFISSASVYTKPLDRFAVVTEKTPTVNPYWEYSQKKAAMEATLRGWHAQGDLPVTIVRPSHTYRRRFPSAIGNGDWTAQRMLDGRPVIVHGDGSSLWTLTHSTDFARPFARLLGNARAVGEDFHITGSNVHTWDEIFTAMARALGVAPRLVHVASDTLAGHDPYLRGPLHGDKAPSTLFDNAKVVSVAGPFPTEMPLDRGFALVAEHFRARTAARGGPVAEPALDALAERVLAAEGRM